jgi:hypothetical protein
MRLSVTKLVLIFSLFLVSMHTSPLAHAGFMGNQLGQRHDCSDHVHPTGDRHDAPDPKAVLPNLVVVHHAVTQCIADAKLVWGVTTPPFVPTSDDAIASRAMRPPIPPPTA